jgi:heat shock protein HtpX
MALALLVSGVLTLALLGAIAWAAVAMDNGWVLALFVVLLALNGVAVTAGVVSVAHSDDEEVRRARWSRRVRPREEAAAEIRRVEAVVQRACVAADLPMPGIEIETGEAPLSWTTALPARKPKLHVTNGLLERATDEQLAVVVAHELTHIARRDAWVMTLVGGPPSWMLLGARALSEQAEGDWFQAISVRIAGACFSAVALPGALAARIVSRHRELTADRGAAVLTGSPARVAATLMTLSGETGSIPHADARVLAARDLFHLLPVGPERARLGRIWATHPPLEARLRQLERMEEALHSATSRI